MSYPRPLLAVLAFVAAINCTSTNDAPSESAQSDDDDDGGDDDDDDGDDDDGDDDDDDGDDDDDDDGDDDDDDGDDDDGDDDDGDDDDGDDDDGDDDDGDDDDGDDDTFSFFVMGMDAIIAMSNSDEGFGGDLGGLEGADEKCQEVAESVGSTRDGWRAFLCTSTVDAIDRIGDGPWYDVQGRLVAENIDGLLAGDRPAGDPAIADDLPDETGQPLSRHGDVHDTLTGCNKMGRLHEGGVTCNDWTSTDINIKSPMIGHAFPRNIGGNPTALNFISDHPATDCSPNINDTGENGQPGVGGRGGYGAWYCFAE